MLFLQNPWILILFYQFNLMNDLDAKIRSFKYI